jgi:hypothetical protein
VVSDAASEWPAASASFDFSVSPANDASVGARSTSDVCTSIERGTT